MAENFSLSPPLRFGMVNPGIYRGAYPVLPNFRFLYQLKLKTIISLTPEPPIEDLRLFGENAGINIIHFPISRTGPLSNELFAQLCQVVQLCVDSANFPIYIHCLDGRRITSVFVLMLRKVQAWNPVSSFTEYWRYQVSFKSLQPMAEIEKTTKDLEKFLSDSIEVSLGDNVPMYDTACRVCISQ
eukprot:gene16007-11454_t